MSANNAEGIQPITGFASPSNDDRTIFINCSTSSVCTDSLDDSTDDFGLTVWLYQDTAWTEWVADRDNDSTETENEKTYITQQSDYTLRMECNVTSVGTNDSDGSKVGYGCCLRDESQSGGGYCMTVNSASDDIDTYFLTDANFETVLADPYDLSSIEEPDDKYAGITLFYITETLDAKKFIGTKVQPWPDAAWAEMYRFEKGDKATGMMYLANESGAARWYDEEMTLNLASFLLGSGSVVATAISCLAYFMAM